MAPICRHCRILLNTSIRASCHLCISRINGSELLKCSICNAFLLNEQNSSELLQPGPVRAPSESCTHPR